jgi:murein L,D-transpeptidase YcbB/YkuD
MSALLLVSAAEPHGTVEALETARVSLAGRAEPEPVGAGPLLREGARGERVARLEHRLVWLGDLEDADGAEFDDRTAQAVRRFQYRRGLKQDGFVGADTLRALDESKAVRIERLDANLEARRAFDPPQGRFVLVNIPDFRLWWLDAQGGAESMRVAIGKEGWETPVIDDSLEAIVVNPEWHLPARIVAADLAPKVAENPRYLAENEIVVLDRWGEGAEEVDPASIEWANLTEETVWFHVVRKAGPENPLGRLKFLFPNEEHVYLHDTPHRDDFDRLSG